ncbi:MAG: tRNA pseudouridine(55) synthase TruB [bacterium]|nr:tRNA pseudouridine(55) synthase TruB [bacterium]
MNGILNINKSKGLTSFDVIAKLRKILNMKRIGHAGTLDPLATGVLPVFIGNSTRLIQYAPKTKSYRAFARLGIETNTYDTEGEIISKKNKTYDLDEIKSALKTFEGKIIQTPPIYSAIKVNGKKLYEYARSDKSVEIPAREVDIFSIKFIDFDNTDEFPLLTFDINCASGVYVRSIIHDLGEKLSSGAMMENLIRTMSANLLIENSVKLEEISCENADKFLINPNNVIDLPEYTLKENEVDKIKKGQYIFDDDMIDGEIKLTFENNLVAIGVKQDGKIKPKTVVL